MALPNYEYTNSTGTYDPGWQGPVTGYNLRYRQASYQQARQNIDQMRSSYYGYDTPETPTYGPTPSGPAPSSSNPAPKPSSPSDYQITQPDLNPGPYTFGTNTLTNPFYDPNSSYIPAGYRGATPDWWSSAGDPNPVTPGNQYAESNPESFYYGLLNQQGFGGLDAKSRAAQSMYADFARGYQAAKFRNPNLLWAQYISQQNVPNLVAMLSDEQLGMQNNDYRGPISWTMRG